MDEEIHSPEYWLHKVREARIALKHVPKSMRTEAVCLAAVHQDGWDLKDVPRALQTELMCRAAVRQNAYVIDIVPKKMKSKVRAALGLP
jgi:hypothetical protein